MTFKRDLKKRIRERQKETGESYTTARERVLQARPELVLELREVPEHPGILCPVRIDAGLWESRAQLLEQLRQILLGPVEGLDAMRRVVLNGEKDSFQHGGALLLVTRIREFRIALQQGLRGPGPGGRMVAFDSHGDGRTIVAQLLPRHDREPILILLQFHRSGMLFDSIDLWLGVRR
jgi:hypothetical protein